jgi:ABC-2 type transport system permease protein
MSASPGRAEIFDLGYQRYDGARTGPWARRKAIWRDGIRIALGLGRGAGAKVAPWLLLGLALFPALLLVVVAAFVGTTPTDPDDFDLPSYAEYYEYAIVPLTLFAAVIAPLLVCPDRADGVLSLYAARPLGRYDYGAARWAAFATVAAAVACLPEAVLFVWYLLDARDTGAWLADEWDVVPRFLAAGLLVAALLTALALLVASFTNRRAYAAIGTLAVLFIGAAVGGIAEENFTGALADVLSLASLPQAIEDGVRWIFGADLGERPLPGWLSAAWLAVVAAVLTGWYLQRMARVMRG